MPRRTIRSILTLLALALVSATISLAQSRISPEASAIATSWQVAQLVGSSKSKVFVITLAQPHRQQICRIQSFTTEKIVCSRAIGGPRTYLPQQVVALILPGDEGLRLRLVLGINGALAAAIWGTVVFAGPCPACAVATGIAALLFFGAAAGAVFIADYEPDRLLYLAPGHQLTAKLRFIQ